jgi:hypothetical protein
MGALCLAAGALAPAAAAQSDQAVDKFWVTDGAVAAIAEDAAKVYLGGKFGRVAPRSGSSVRLEAASGAPSTPFPYVRGVVRAVAPDGAGGWFLGGAFDKVGDIFRNNVAHVLADGRLSNWQPNVNGPVFALARDGGFVYLGGAFTSVAGFPRARLARVDTAFGNLDPTWNPNVVGVELLALQLAGGVVYVGGTFSGVNGPPTPLPLAPRNNAAAVLTSSGAATPWDPNANGTVRALAVAPPSFYLGGDFTTVNGVPHNRLALVDAAGVLQGAWNPSPDAPVRALAVPTGGTPVYAGGAFLNIGGQPRARVAALDAAGAALAAFNPGADGDVDALALSGFGVYLGGGFTQVAGSPRRHLAFVDPAGVLGAWNPHAFGPVEALAFDPRPAGPDWIYAGGGFAAVGGVARRNLAAFVKASGAVDATWAPEPDGPVHALRRAAGGVYVGGEFTTIGGQPRNSLAAVSDLDGSAAPWNPNVTGGAPSAVRTMDFDFGAGVIYVGGDFTTVNAGTARQNAAAFNVSTAAATAWNPAPNAGVRELRAFPPLLTVDLAGDFTQVNLLPLARPYFAAVGSVFGTASPFSANANAPAYSFLVFGSELFLGGAFSQLGTPPQPRSRAGAVDGLLAATAWDPNVSGSRVRALVQDSATTAMLGGGFTAVGGQPRNNLAQVSLAAPGAPTPWNPDANGGDVHAILPTPPMVFVGGEFRFASGRPQRSFAAFCKAPTVTGVTATAAGPNAIQVNWTDNGAPSYMVYRSESGLPFELIGSGASGGVGLTDFAAEGGLTYAYVVRAEQGDCESDASTAALASTSGACGRAPVFDGAADALQLPLPACRVRVTWNGALGRCGATPTYNVYRGTSPTFVPDASTLFAQGLSSFSWTDEADLAPSATYYYIVRAFDRGNGEEDPNLIRVGVTLSAGCTGSLPPPVDVLTSRARSGENRLEWVYPLGFGTVDLRYDQSAGPNSPCTPPPDTASGTSLGPIVGTPGAAAGFDHLVGAGANDHNFCYSAFVLGVSPSLPVSAEARPAALPAPVSWAFTSGASALSRPAVIPQRAYLGVSNDRHLHAMTPSPAGGVWPSTPVQWTPPALNAAALGRPTVVELPTTTVGGASKIALVGAQDGRVYCFNAESGALLWVANGGLPLGDGIVAPPSVLVQDFGATPANLALVGTRNATSDNQLVALNLGNGSLAWAFDNGGGPGAGIGIISGQPLVEYGTPPRVYFTSRRRAGGSASTVWALDVGAGSAALAWAADHGEIDGAVTRRGGVLYVGNNGGEVRALSRVSGGQNWSLNLGDGPVKGFVWPDALSSRLYASTSSRVHALVDNGGSASPFWSTPLTAVPNPSTPVLIGATLYVGGGDGRLHSAVANVGGPPPATTSVLLGDPTVPKVLGAPTFDRGNPGTAADDIVMVGTDEGRFYAIHPPF